ncbi:hypothetical protein ACN5LY_002270 [Cronobacter dublinensis]|uniref:hypothetical protein n=1 Tax=Cronobacter dublinensis TaxID=413497 RepID=UPI0024AE9BDC|nr:hypothetical protein [Cronobacter dublinensis]MDI7504418.1 hypothetical protein [Cronobacter dublinensis]
MNPFLYQPRSAVFHGVLEFDDRRLKIYRIASQEQAGVPLPDRDRQRALLREALREDRWPTDHQIGFAIFHFANDGAYLLVSSWCDANMLRHRVFMISPQGRLEPLDASRIIACVWELAIVWHERNLWIQEAMAQTAYSAAGVQRYLTQGYEGWV